MPEADVPKVGQGFEMEYIEFGYACACVVFTFIPLVFYSVHYIKPVGHGCIGLIQACFSPLSLL